MKAAINEMPEIFQNCTLYKKAVFLLPAWQRGSSSDCIVAQR